MTKRENKLQIEKLKAEIKYAQIKNNYFENFNQPMSRRAEIAIKPQIIKPQRIVSSMINRFESHQSPYDAKIKDFNALTVDHYFAGTQSKNFNLRCKNFKGI